MRLITPAGKMDFNWSPKEQDLVKTASTGEVQRSDKDALYEAAKKHLKAQSLLDETAIESGPCDAPPCGDADGMGGGMGLGSDKALPPPASDEVALQTPAVGASGDAVKAVQELADKANKAEEVAAKVGEAVAKVEQAVSEVKDAVGGVGEATGAVPNEVVMDVEVEDEGGEEKSEGEEHEKSESPDEEKAEHEEGKEDEADEKSEKSEKPDFGKKKDKEDEGGEDEEDIIQKSCAAAKKRIKMETSADDINDFVKTAKISNETRKKVTKLWKDYLGYDPEFVKLMTTNYEK